MIAPRRALSVLVPNPELARDLPDHTCIRKVSNPETRSLESTTYVFVVVSLLELPRVATFVREANQRHYLRGLFVRDAQNTHLLPQILHRANLRTVSNLVVHPDGAVPNRVLLAFCAGAEDALIADARLIGNHLFLISCAGETFDLPMDRHPALKEIPGPDRGRFTLASDGAYLHWAKSDIHLDLEDARVFLDPHEREKVRARRAQASSHFGQAMSVYRRSMGLRQRDIPGLSERQVRRYEHGSRVPLASLKLLAKAHGMELNQYLNRLAEGAT